MTNITETVQSALQSNGYGQYTSYAAPVIEALEAREQAVVDSLMEIAQDKGLSAVEAERVLIQAGLVEPTPEPVSTVAGGQDEDSLSLTAQVAHLASIVERLVQAAAQRGLRI